MRHGPHHAAQKSTRIGTFDAAMISLKELSSAAIGWFIGGSGALQTPQRPASDRCCGGILFFAPQEAHADTSE